MRSEKSTICNCRTKVDDEKKTKTVLQIESILNIYSNSSLYAVISSRHVTGLN